MQINSKSMKNATSPLFRNHNRSALPAGTYINIHRLIYYSLVLFAILLTIFNAKSLPIETFIKFICSLFHFIM